MIIQSSSRLFPDGNYININGIKKPYIAKEDISKGEFVQLNTEGAEISTFTELSSFSNTSNGKNGVSICVLSPTLIMYTYAEYAKWGTVGECNVYAQAACYKSGVWTAGPKLLICTKSGAYFDIDMTRLNDTHAAACFGCKEGTASSSASLCSFYILTANEAGEVAIAASSVDSLSIGNLLYTPVHVIGVNDTCFAVLLPSSNYGGLGVVSCTYSGEKLAHTASVLQIYAGSSTNDYGLIYACKLNESSIIISHNSGSNSTSSVKAPVIVRIAGTSMVKEDADITVYCGPMCRIADNQVVLLPYAKSKPIQLLTYNTENSTLAKSDILTAGAYYHYELLHLADNKLCALASTGTNPQSTDLCLAIIDTVNLTCTYTSTLLSGAASASCYSIHIADSYGEWVAVMGGRTSALVTPAIKQTTVSPFATRIDGVAISDTASGDVAFIIVPE